MASTLIVGLGGMGLKVVSKIAERAEREHLQDVEFVVMDTDVNDLRRIKEKNSRIYTVQTSPNGTVGGALDQNHFARERWFPINDGLTGKPFTEGAGQVRAVSRLAFDHAVSQGYMAELEKAIEKLHGISGDSMRQEMRIMIVGSNNGGTGSGLVLPVAMFIRNFLITRYQDNSAIIRGFFLEPDTIFDRITDEEERNSLRCNAYATIRELDAFFRKEYSGDSDEFRHVVFNAPQPGSGERVDYPNILPYHFVFLMDAINSEGEHLPSHDAYLEHAAESIYAQALSAVSARSNSSEDNIIRNIVANNGRSRYCGAGAAYLEYPADKVIRYVGLKWANENISSEWLEIDDEYEIQRRENDELKLRDFYLETYSSKMNSVKFYKRISKEIVQTFEANDGSTSTSEPAREYPDNLLDYADAVNEGDVRRHCGEMQRALKAMELNDIPQSGAQIDRLVQRQGKSAASSITAVQDNYYQAACRYNQAVADEVTETSRNLARSAFTISDYDRDPLSSKQSAWQIENVLRVENNAKIGAVHPGAARYMLYTASAELEECIEDCKSKIAAAESEIDSFKDDWEEAKRNGNKQQQAEPEAKKGGLPLPGGAKKEAMDSADKGMLMRRSSMLFDFRDAIDRRRLAIVQKAYLEAAKSYIDSISDAYEGFYRYLRACMADIQAEIKAIEFDSRMNAAKGDTHKYVCSNTKCLNAMYDRCPVRGDSSELPVELRGDIYRSLLKYAKLSKETRSNDVKNAAFKTLFSKTVIDYWTNRVLDPNMGYPQIIDMNIAQAIVAEGEYLCEDTFVDDKARNRYLASYLTDAFDQAYHLAAPFIEPPVGEMPRTFKTCAYADSILNDAGFYYDELANKLSELNGTPLDSRHYSKYSIMFYRSMYGFCADNLPKYAPERTGLQHTPEGEYHHAYFSLVNQLSPNLKENRFITPHIDRNWHLVAALPDLNEANERAINNEIVRSYIYGLIFQEFSVDRVSTGDDIFYIKGTSAHPRTDLWVSNGTICDRFYEVYDALKYNPKAVKMLVGRSDARMAKEKNESICLAVENCELIENTRSRAFLDNYRAQAEAIPGAEEILDSIRALKQEGPRRAANLVKLPSRLVTNLFNQGEDGNDNRHSVLEIPLYYRISLPHSEFRAGEIETMIECIFAIIRDHFANFCDGIDLDDQTTRFFEEQYVLFERNLVAIEREFPGIYANRTVSAIREKTLSAMEAISRRHKRVKDFQNKVDSAWYN